MKCSYCKEPAIFAVSGKGRSVKRFCEDCLLVLVTEAIRVIGDRLKDLLAS